MIMILEREETIGVKVLHTLVALSLRIFQHSAAK
jgi:hypothetical protein